jgi:hypothetical protein
MNLIKLSLLIIISLTRWCNYLIRIAIIKNPLPGIYYLDLSQVGEYSVFIMTDYEVYFMSTGYANIYNFFE